MDLGLKNKVAIIGGASKGLGEGFRSSTGGRRR
ncbi:MAG: hypothetical protein CM1200mP22_21160 [Dehalococcoidia bacterium]|nr:MAG: hypothetical protein CM1200mP22_21160 [Dehalococcoidia bacterium]